jgi:hypothetical protein
MSISIRISILLFLLSVFWAPLGFCSKPHCERINYKNLSFQTIVEAINNCKITTVEALLEKLPKEFLSGFALMRKSKSLQDASPLFPRAVVFGRNAKLIMTFNGDASQAGYDSLEFVSFNEKTSDFEFKEISFASKLKLVRPIIAQHPQSCVSCHRSSSPRPNWEAYNFWPGAYGSFEDTIRKGSEEDLQLVKFLKNRPNHSRYKYLIGDIRDLRNPAFKGFGLYYPTLYTVNKMPNIIFNILVSRLNYKHINKFIRKSPHFREFKFSILAALFDCERIDQFIPDDLRVRFKMNYNDILNESIAGALSNFDDLKKIDQLDHQGQSEILDKYFFKETKYLNVFAKLRYLFENRGISLSDWSMSFNRRAYAFSNGISNIYDLLLFYLEDLKTLGVKLDYRELRNYREYFGITPAEFGKAEYVSTYGFARPGTDVFKENCRILKTHSLENLGVLSDSFKLGDVSIIQHEPRTRSVKELAQLCAGCHNQGRAGAPVIPFHDTKELSRKFKDSPYFLETAVRRIQSKTSSRMPPNQDLSESEVKELEKSWRDLAGLTHVH